MWLLWSCRVLAGFCKRASYKCIIICRFKAPEDIKFYRTLMKITDVCKIYVVLFLVCKERPIYCSLYADSSSKIVYYIMHVLICWWIRVVFSGPDLVFPLLGVGERELAFGLRSVCHGLFALLFVWMSLVGYDLWLYLFLDMFITSLNVLKIQTLF